MTDLAKQITELAAKATPGPWRLSGASLDGFKPVMGPGGVIVALLSTLAGRHKDDAALIVLLRNNVDTILAWKADADRLRGMREALKPFAAIAETVQVLSKTLPLQLVTVRLKPTDTATDSSAPGGPRGVGR